MTTDEKRAGQSPVQSDGGLVGDTTTRARNRTVMLNSEIAGQVRARLGGDFHHTNPERSGGLNVGADAGDDGWAVPESDASGVNSELLEGLHRENPVIPSEEVEPTPVQDYSDLNVFPGSELDAPVLSEKEEAPPTGERFNDWTTYSIVAEEEEGSSLVETSFAPSRAAPAGILKRGVSSVSGVHPREGEFRPMTQGEYLETFVEPSDEFGEGGYLASESVTWKSPTILVGFLVSYDFDKKGAYIELRTGRLMVTSEHESSGNCLVVRHPSVSPMHAIMRVGTGGTVQVLDQLSEHGTKIRHVDSQEEELLSGEKGTLHHGDVVFFGERSFHVCLITPPSE